MLRVLGVLPAFVAFVVMWNWKPRLPHIVAVPVMLWVVLQGLYAIPALAYDPKLGVAAVLTGIGPIGLVKVGYVVVARHEDSLERLARGLGWFVIGLLPISLVAVVLGNEALPYWLRAIEAGQEAGVETYKGLFQSPSSIFPTPTDMAHAMLATTYILVAVIQRRIAARKATMWMWVYAVVGALLAYLCARRMIFMAVAVGLVPALMRSRRSRTIGGLLLAASFVAIMALDTSGMVDSGASESRSAVYENLPVNEYFNEWVVGVTGRWLELRPLGSFLGYAGPVGEAFGVDWDYPIVEVGAALLVAETGVLGILLMSGLVLSVIASLFVRSRGLRCRYVVWQMLLYFAVCYLIFLMKSSRFLTLGSMAHLCFWLAPGIAAALIRNEHLSSSETI